jgi:hypothetical protein
VYIIQTASILSDVCTCLYFLACDLQLPDKEEVEAARKAAEEHRQHLAAVREAAAKSNTGEGMHKVSKEGASGEGKGLLPLTFPVFVRLLSCLSCCCIERSNACQHDMLHGDGWTVPHLQRATSSAIIV